MSRLSPFGFLFGTGLTDLVRGIRRYKDEDQRKEYLRGVVSECREEVRSVNLDVKSQAVLKLAYLEMLGIDMSWCGFHVVEVMASQNFQQKRVGYMAASQCFRSDDELKMLVTNLLKMDLVNQNSATVGVALSGLATIVSPGLAADISDDIMRMLSHSKPYIRKKAVLAMYNIIIQYPEVLPQAMKRFGDLLEECVQNLDNSGNVSVAGAVVTVICELVSHMDSIKDSLELTPMLYNLFTKSEHNWTLIKLMKIFQTLTRKEPRLKTRLLPAVENMMIDSDASALVYESMKCIIDGNMISEDDYGLASKIVRSIEGLLETKDPNLKYMSTGLLYGLAKVNQRFLPVDMVVSLIKNNESDRGIRKNIYKLSNCIVDDDNIIEIIQELLMQFKSTDNYEYKEDVAHAISDIGASNNYQHVPDFEWYLQVLQEIADVVADEVISKRLLDIVLRVKDADVREIISKLCFHWLQKHLSREFNPDETYRESNVTVYKDIGDNNNEFRDTCWWIVGEYVNSDVISDPIQLVNLISLTTIENPVVISTMVKVIASFARNDSSTHEQISSLLSAVVDELTEMSYSLDFEVQERACQFLEFLKLVKSTPDKQEALLNNGLSSLFHSPELGPIAPGSQKRLTVPADLDLTTPVEGADFNVRDNVIEFSSEEENEYTEYSTDVRSTYFDEPLGSELPQDEIEKREAERKIYVLSDQIKRVVSNEVQAVTKKLAKKKVTIASDETVEEPSAPNSTVGNNNLVDSNTTTKTAGLVNELPPVKVKHKKKKKHRDHKESKAL